MVRNFARAACGWMLMVLLATSSSAADDAVLAEFYGTGVHYYFAGNYGQAVADLTAAIDGGSKDPRAYYFRALAESQLGQADASRQDLQQGAALESADINQFYPVGKSLERVQGASRLAIERYRAVARAQAHQRQQQRNAIRYEQRRRAEGQVLRSPAFAPPATRASGSAPLPAPSVKPPAAAPSAEDDPFAEKDESAAKPEAAAEEMPAEEAPAEKPAADNAPSGDEPAEDPFADPPAKGAADEKPAAEKPPAKEPNPPAKAEDDPFADDKEATPGVDNAGKATPPAEEDPFK